MTVTVPEDVTADLLALVRIALRDNPELAGDPQCLMDEVRMDVPFGCAARVVTQAVHAAIAVVLEAENSKALAVRNGSGSKAPPRRFG